MPLLTLPEMTRSPVDCANWIGGKLIYPKEKLSTINSPYSGQTIGTSFRSQAQDIAHAIENARTAQRGWQEQTLRERAEIFFRFRQWLLDNAESVAQTIAAECGKLPREAKDEILKGIEVSEFALSQLQHDSLNKTYVSKGVSCEYRRVPLGVVAGITPSNFPAMVPMWMIPIAIMAGNAFIWKPSEKTPLTSLLLARGLQSCGLPDGILNIIQGDKITVELLCKAEGVAAVGFVGSTPAAQFVYHTATATNKRALTLGGAKNHIFLMPDADPALAVGGIVASFTGCAGQRCMAASVLLAIGNADDMIKRICTHAAKLELGSDMGAIISRESLTRLTQALERGKREGLSLLLDGRQKINKVTEYAHGNWLGACILDQVSPQSFAAQEELFGPILSVIHCPTLDAALAIENANPYGNAASIFTSSGAHAEHVARYAQAGMIGINVGIPVPREPFSFGGIGASKFGQGDITGHDGIEFWSYKKKVTTKWVYQAGSNWMS